MPMLGDLGTLAVTLGAKTGQFTRDLDGAEKKLGNTAKSMRGFIGSAAKVGVAAVAAGAAIVGSLVVAGLRAIDSQAKLARSIDGTIDGLRGLQIAANDAGVSEQALTTSVTKLNQALGVAMRTAGPARDTLDKLGLSAAQLSKMDADQRLAAVSDRVRQLGLSSSQTADVLRNLGITSADMVNFMRQGGDAIRAARQEVDDFGLSVSAVDAAQIEAANSALSRIGRVLEGIRNQLTIAVAPILQELAERFNNLAKANQGFGDHARRAAEIGIRGFAKLIDVVHGVRVALKGAELIGVGFGAALISAAQIGAEAITWLADFVNDKVNFMIEGLNKLPGVDIATLDPLSDSAFMQGLRGMANEARDRVGQVRSELHELAMQDMPSGKVLEFLDAVRARAAEAAEAAAAASEAIRDEFAEGFSDDEAEDPELAKLRKQLEGRLQAVREYAMSEDELERAQHAARMETLLEALEAELLAEDEYRQIRERLEEEHMDRLEAIRKKGLDALQRFTEMSFRNQAKTVTEQLVNMTAGVATHSRKMFEINKIAGIANAIIATHEGVAATLKAYPYPLSVAMAAAQAAAGMAQVNAIRSQSFSGGGSAPSLAGSTAAPAVSPVEAGAAAPTQQRQTIYVEGLSDEIVMSGKQVRSLYRRLQEAADDGATLVF